jgi:hypothetical protein
MPEYISVAIEQDPEEYANLAYDSIQTRWPDWEPHEGNLETAIIEGIASIAAELGGLLTTVPDAIFRWFGAKLVGLPPIEASEAGGSTDWTMIDNLGYTIPAGTQVGIRSAGDELHLFETNDETIVAPGSTTALNVGITALEEGIASSGIGTVGGPVELIDTLDFVLGVTLDAPTSGGTDAEEDDAYLSRLSSRLRLLSPRPVLAEDFAILAKDIAGIDRSLVLDTTDSTLTQTNLFTLVSGNAANLTLTFEREATRETTGVIAGNATAGTIETALEATVALAPADVIVSGGPLGTAPVVIEIGGAFAGQLVNLRLNAGHATQILTVTREGGWKSDVEKAVTIVPLDAAGLALDAGTIAELDAYLQSLREINFIIRVETPDIDSIPVTFDFRVFAGFDPIAAKAAGEGAIANLLSPANWGQPPTGEERRWLQKRVVRLNDVIAAVDAAEGIDWVTNVRIDGNAADYYMSGQAPLPSPGTITGTAI